MIQSQHRRLHWKHSSINSFPPSLIKSDYSVEAGIVSDNFCMQTLMQVCTLSEIYSYVQCTPQTPEPKEIGWWIWDKPWLQQKSQSGMVVQTCNSNSQDAQIKDTLDYKVSFRQARNAQQDCLKWTNKTLLKSNSQKYHTIFSMHATQQNNPVLHLL